MEQLDFFDIPSPCIGVCSVDDKGYCKGCMRTRDERFGWLTLTPIEKKRIIRLCKQRYQRKLKRQSSTDGIPLPDSEPQDPQRPLF